MAIKEVIEVLKKYISLLNFEGISVKKAFLFGNYSVNSAHENSDIDVMIVSDKYDENDDLIIGVWSLTRKINTIIEPYLIGMERFKEDNPFVNIIKTQSIEIV